MTLSSSFSSSSGLFSEADEKLEISTSTVQTWYLFFSFLTFWAGERGRWRWDDATAADNDFLLGLLIGPRVARSLRRLLSGGEGTEILLTEVLNERRDLFIFRGIIVGAFRTRSDTSLMRRRKSNVSWCLLIMKDDDSNWPYSGMPVTSLWPPGWAPGTAGTASSA